MKKAKKLLCLALVLVMALGMIQIASAADFTDEADINYPEAAAVLKEIDVIEGYDDGSFGPDRFVTRAEAAAMITRMLLGRELADKLPVAVSFPDVPPTEWFAKYVSYCAGQGIIVGHPDGNFYPQANVRGSELAIMLLRALGLGTPSNYVGAAWEINAIIDGMKFGILNSNVDYTTEANRDQTALYVFNALIKGETVTMTGTRYRLDAGAGFGALLAADQTALSAIIGNLYDTEAAAMTAARALVATLTQGYHVVCTPQTYTYDMDIGSIATELYKLKYDGAVTDPFTGLPGFTWTIGTTVIYSGTNASPSVPAYTEVVTSGTLYTDLGRASIATASSLLDGFAGSDFTIESNGTARTGGNGILTEVYATTGTTNPYKIAQVTTFVGIVTAVDEDKGEVDIDDLSETHYITAHTFTYKSTTLEKDDIVLYTGIWDGTDFEVKTVSKAESLDIVPTGRTNVSFDVGGDRYFYSAQFKTSVAVAVGDVTGAKEKVIYFDKYGYVIYVSDPAVDTTTNLAVLLFASKTPGAGGWNPTPDTFSAVLLLDDGAIEEVTTNEDGFDLFDVGDPAASPPIAAGAKIVEYGPGPGGVTVFTHLAEVQAGAVDIKTNKVSFDAAGGPYNGSLTTLFFVKTAATPPAQPTFTVYTGVTEVPTLTGGNAAVYVDAGKVIAVYIDDAVIDTSSESSDIAFVNYATRSEGNGDSRGAYTRYQAVVNGEVVNFDVNATSDATLHTTLSSITNIYGAITYDANNLVTGVTVNTAITGSGTGISASGGIATIGSDGFVYNAETMFFVMTATGINKIEPSAITAAHLTATVAYYTANGLLAGVFITP